MDEFECLSHTRWECKHHVVFIPKRRRKALFGQVLPRSAGAVIGRPRQPTPCRKFAGSRLPRPFRLPPRSAIKAKGLSNYVQTAKLHIFDITANI